MQSLIIVFFGILYGLFITVLLIPSKSENLYPTKFELCKQDLQCSYTVSDIPNSVAETYLNSKK
jgi:hypothetical protein